ncbi:MAG: hypothetical protein FJZ87_09045 [Chloroflexi bacterium]|nr:hypothetical protein [Chloroflexota bacterium]
MLRHLQPFFMLLFLCLSLGGLLVAPAVEISEIEFDPSEFEEDAIFVLLSATIGSCTFSNSISARLHHHPAVQLPDFPPPKVS